MPDEKDIEWVEQDFWMALNRAQEIYQALIQVAKEYNEQEGDEYYDIEEMQERLKKIQDI